MKKLIFTFLFCIVLFSGCWIEPKINDYKKSNSVYYCSDYDTMRSLIVPEINKTFSDWHWSHSEFDKKYNKYKNNIPVSDDWISHLHNKGYEYVFFSGVTSDTIQCYDYSNKRVYIEGNYFIIIRDNGDAVTFFQKAHGLDESTVPVVPLPCNLN